MFIWPAWVALYLPAVPHPSPFLRVLKILWALFAGFPLEYSCLHGWVRSLWAPAWAVRTRLSMFLRGNWWNTLGEEISLTTGWSMFSGIFSSSALFLPRQCDEPWPSRTAAKLQCLQQQVMSNASSAWESRWAQGTLWSGAFVQHNLQNRAAETPPDEKGSWQWRWRPWSLSESSEIVVWVLGSASAVPRISHWATAAFLPDVLREIVQEDGGVLRIRTSCPDATLSLAVRKPDLSSGLTRGTID